MNDICQNQQDGLKKFNEYLSQTLQKKKKLEIVVQEAIAELNMNTDPSTLKEELKRILWSSMQNAAANQDANAAGSQDGQNIYQSNRGLAELVENEEFGP